MSGDVCEKVSLDDDGDIDEIFADNVSVHIERMRDGHIWMSIERGNEAQIVNFYTARGAKIIGSTTKETYPVPKKPIKALKGIPIGSYEEIKDAAGKMVIKPKSSRKMDVSARIKQRKSKKVFVKRRGA